MALPSNCLFSVCASERIMGRSWFLIVLFLNLTFNCLSEDTQHDKKLPLSAVVVGTVYCDSCFQEDFPMTSHFISGATVAVECNGDTNPSFRKEVKTDEHGKFKLTLPFQVSKNVRKIKGCSVKLIRSSEPYCAVASSAISSSLNLKSMKQGEHIFSAGFYSFKPLKQPSSCYQKPRNRNSRVLNSVKRVVPTNYDPTFPPPLQDPPSSFLPPLPELPGLPPLQLPPLPPLSPKGKSKVPINPTETSSETHIQGSEKSRPQTIFPPFPFLPNPFLPNPFQPPPIVPNPFQPPPLIPNPFQPPPAPLIPNPFQPPPSPSPLIPNPFQPPPVPRTPLIPNPFQPPPAPPAPLIPNPFQPPPTPPPAPSPSPLIPFPPIPGLAPQTQPPPPPPPPSFPFPFPPIIPTPPGRTPGTPPPL